MKKEGERYSFAYGGPMEARDGGQGQARDV